MKTILKVAESAVLSKIARSHGIVTNDLAVSLGFSPAVLKCVLFNLERFKLVEKMDDRVYLTLRGRVFLAALLKV